MNTKSKNIIKRILSIFLVIVTVLSSLSLDNVSNLFVKKAEAASNSSNQFTPFLSLWRVCSN